MTAEDKQSIIGPEMLHSKPTDNFIADEVDRRRLLQNPEPAADDTEKREEKIYIRKQAPIDIGA